VLLYCARQIPSRSLLSTAFFVFSALLALSPLLFIPVSGIIAWFSPIPPTKSRLEKQSLGVKRLLPLFLALVTLG
jgi:hypothetical protein